MSTFYESPLLILASVIAVINAQFPCDIHPTDTELYVDIYINGGTEGDRNVIAGYCSSPFTAADGPVEVKFRAGAQVIEDANGYHCVNEPSGSCLYAYFLLCISRLTDRSTFNQLLCCTISEGKSLFPCIVEFNFTQGVDDCLHYRTSYIDPYAEVLENAKYLKKFNIPADDSEPYTLVHGDYDKCKSDMAETEFTELICLMLDVSVAEDLNCPT